MGCGSSKAVVVEDKPQTAFVQKKRKPGVVKVTAKAVDVDDIDDISIDAPQASKSKPLVQRQTSHDAKMLLGSWSKPTEDSAHKKIIQKIQPVVSGENALVTPSKSRVTKGAKVHSQKASAPVKVVVSSRAGNSSSSYPGDRDTDHVDSSDDDDSGYQVQGGNAGTLPGAVEEDSLMSMFRPKSALKLDLD